MASKSFGIIILGCPSTYKGLPSKMFEQRLMVGQKIYQDTKPTEKPVLICTGYHAPGAKESQAAAMKKKFTSKGIPAEHVIAEEEARCTIENSIYSKSILDKLGIKDITVVTSEFHMNRAKYIFESIYPGYDLHFESAPDGIPQEKVEEMAMRENRKMVNLRSELMLRAEYN